MKALSLWQPWATLFAAGIKTHETRHCRTAHRGPLAVHAAKRQEPAGAELWALLRREHPRLFTSRLPELFLDLPFGAFVGKVEIVDCVPTETLWGKIERVELQCGDFTGGRYAWKAIHPVLFTEPIPARGQQVLWDALEIS